MNQDGYSDKHYRILSRINLLPKKILSLHNRGEGYVAEFVLHELSGPLCFDFEKSAYFVDNPDFNKFRGIAGFSNEGHYEEIWDDTPSEKIIEYFSTCMFNQNVRGIKRDSFGNEENIINGIKNDLAKELEINNVQYFVWPLKHDNYGILIYQAKDEGPELKEFIYHGLYLLGFCPIQ